MIDATAGAVDAIVFVALAGVAPIGEEDAPVWCGEEIDATEPGVADVEEIGEMRGEIAAALGEEFFAIEAPAVEVDGEELVMEFGGPGVALVDEATFVSVTAAEGVGAIFFAPGFLPLAGIIPVEMIGVLGEEFVGVGGEIFAIHAIVVGAGDEVPEVADDRIGEEGFAEVIPIEAPGVGGA